MEHPLSRGGHTHTHINSDTAVLHKTLSKHDPEQLYEPASELYIGLGCIHK